MMMNNVKMLKLDELQINEELFSLNLVSFVLHDVVHVEMAVHRLCLNVA